MTRKVWIRVTSALTIGAAIVALNAGPSAAANPNSLAGACTENNSRQTYQGNGTSVPTNFSNSASCLVRRGHRGDPVRLIQDSMNECYQAGIVADGIFGSATEAAVRSVQRQSGTTPDGIWGRDTTLAVKWPADIGDASIVCSQVVR